MYIYKKKHFIKSSFSLITDTLDIKKLFAVSPVPNCNQFCFKNNFCNKNSKT